jgi:hypothetical protein
LCVTDWKELPKVSNSSSSIFKNIDASSEDSDISSDSEFEDISDVSEIDDNKSSLSAEPSTRKTKNGKLSKPDEYYKLASFSEEHPQCETHKVRLVKENEAKIPNFVGGILPRCDKGNHEDYCMVMLTLFKPWRTGTELRLPNTTWGSSFATHVFSGRQNDIMDNFNLRYECNDARDDFASQRKLLSTSTENWPFELSNDMLDDIDENFDSMLFSDHCDFQDGDNWMNLATEDKSSRLQIERMMAADAMLQKNGMLNNEFDSPVNIESLPTVNNTAQSGYYWQNLLTKEKDRILEKRFSQAASAQALLQTRLNSTVNQVKLLDQSYFEHIFKATDPVDQTLIEDTILKYTLNEAQARAFRIISNHATLTNPQQLKMYLGGMAGTGKSQVIKALMYFFQTRNETFRFMCMAPTGSAASLIGGSTYHSVLGINPYREKNDQLASLSEVQAIIQHVDYIFMDEISMIDCVNLYNISKQMCIALNNEFDPFGGKNVIFAGDFAQLPPVSVGQALYSQKVNSVIHTTMSHVEQEAALGKAIWHQFTIAVILRENMRQ